MNEQLAVIPEQSIEIDAGLHGTVLKELTAADAPRIYELANFKPEHFTSVGEDIPNVCTSVEAVEAWLAEVKSGNQAPWERVELGVWAKDELVGCMGYGARDDVAMIWYWVGKAHTGHGYAADAVQTLVPYLLKRGHTNIGARVRKDNEASIRTLAKSGFIASDTRNDYVRFRFMGAKPAQSKALAA